MSLITEIEKRTVVLPSPLPDSVRNIDPLTLVDSSGITEECHNNLNKKYGIDLRNAQLLSDRYGKTKAVRVFKIGNLIITEFARRTRRKIHYLIFVDEPALG